MWIVGAGLLVLAYGLRAFAGDYADPLAIDSGIRSAIFWSTTRMPPSVAHLLSMIGAMAILLAWARRFDFREHIGRALRIIAVYGRVPLFLYIIHGGVYYLYPGLSGTVNQHDVLTTWVAAIAGLVVMYYPCLWYQRLRIRYGRVLRLF